MTTATASGRRRGPDFELLRGVPVFEGLPPSALEDLLAAMERRVFRKGDLVFTQGEKVERLYVLEHGRVEVFKSDITGKRLTLWFAKAGDAFCLGNLFSESAFANALARQDSVALGIGREDLFRALRKEAGLIHRFVACISRRLAAYAEIVETLAFRSVQQRLAAFLWRCVSLDCTKEMTCTVTRSEMASLLGTRREVVSRALRRLGTAGIIELVPSGKARHAKVLDPDRLEAVARGDLSL
ncbi:Crp/Fnr family transcriptional regulator [Dissulfurirhabdus thermomarina]|uniref:Crp/Fnr family transcriptional regulator n=1 Tax=Dissulfurirhabdus thermomarina TaxID=1765737 RepID=A0A6N9TP05_DISTH|nr:Crp/Fnr family transcriptional regulator [Dissulfurirhabdus thermomarina]NDY43011.1 Crp/Fnr family transcriptional regulator [Dissulfurirhabdus thermomarina]NMX23832.1 Crp/Fnr family transcriptional regulator [Dissulfurirhabdus thermomarina]